MPQTTSKRMPTCANCWRSVTYVQDDLCEVCERRTPPPRFVDAQELIDAHDEAYHGRMDE